MNDEMEKMAKDLGLDALLDAVPEGDPWAVTGTKEGRIFKLEEVRSKIPPPIEFKVNSYVTPKEDSGVKGHGKPMLVIEQTEVEYIIHNKGTNANPTDTLIFMELAGRPTIFKMYSGYLEPFYTED